MRGSNKCSWLVVASSERCGRRCKDRLCFIHRAQLRKKPGTEPHPCRMCGKGTKGESRLCSKACGSDRVKKALRSAEVKARRNYPKVIHELQRRASQAKLFVGLK